MKYHKNSSFDKLMTIHWRCIIIWQSCIVECGIVTRHLISLSKSRQPLSLSANMLWCIFTHHKVALLKYITCIIYKVFITAQEQHAWLNRVGNTAWTEPSLLNLPNLCKVSNFYLLFVFTFYSRHPHFWMTCHLPRHLTNFWKGFDEAKIKIGQSIDNLLTRLL